MNRPQAFVAALMCFTVASCQKMPDPSSASTKSVTLEADRTKANNNIDSLILQYTNGKIFVEDNDATWEIVPIINIGTTIDEVNKTLGPYLPVSYLMPLPDGTYEYSYISNGYEYLVYSAYSSSGEIVVRAKRRKTDQVNPWNNSEK